MLKMLRHYNLFRNNKKQLLRNKQNRTMLMFNAICSTTVTINLNLFVTFFLCLLCMRKLFACFWYQCHDDCFLHEQSCSLSGCVFTDKRSRLDFSIVFLLKIQLVYNNTNSGGFSKNLLVGH